MFKVYTKIDFFIIFTYEADIKANTLDVAIYNVPKLICISCRLNYGTILILSISIIESIIGSLCKKFDNDNLYFIWTSCS